MNIDPDIRASADGARSATGDSRRENHPLPVLAELLTALTMGGAENLAVQIANAHAQHGGQAHLVVLSEPGPLSSRVDSRVKLHYLGYSRASIRNPLRFLVSVVRGFRLLSGVIADNRIEVMQTHLPDANLWGVVLAVFRKCRVYVTIHNNLFFGDRKRFGISKLVIGWAYRLMFRKCDGVIMCSEEVRNSVLEGLDCPLSDRERVHVVTNGVLPPEALAEGERATLRSRWSVGDGDFFLLAAGRFTDAKNFACLVAAVAALKNTGYFPKLVIGGEGPLRSAVIEQIGESGLAGQIQVPGNIPDLLKVMQVADCLALSSRWEGLPLVLLEGMIRGLPVVGTRIKGLMETVREGTDGYLVDVDDPDALAAAIAKLMDDRTSASQMGNAGREHVEEKYSFSRVYRELLEIIAPVITP